MAFDLYILRHAQAGSVEGADKDRPLTAKGIADMHALAQKMRADNLVPSYVHCSSARRTRQTLGTLRDAGGVCLADDFVIFADDLYNASAGALYEALKRTPSSCASAMIVAHNPGIYALALTLGSGEVQRAVGTAYPPGTLTVLSAEAERWEDIMPASCSLKAFLPVGSY